MSSDIRVLRVLAVLPWVAAHPDGVPIREVCERFDVDERTLVRDLETASMVGVAPFSPDSYVGVVIEDDRVWVHYPQWFDRPLRLTPEQGLALVAAARGLASLEGADGDGPLARATDKIAAVMGIEPGDALDVDFGDAPGEVLGPLRAAAEEHRRVRMRYYAFGRQQDTERTVEPLRIFAAEGEWYLAAHCLQAGALRLFRVDRVRDVQLTDDTFEPPAALPEISTFEAGAAAPRVEVDLSPAAAWVADRYPVEASEVRPDGSLRVRLAVAERGWLERLLVRLGPAATVVGGDDSLAHCGQQAAARVLRRYEPAG